MPKPKRIPPAGADVERVKREIEASMAANDQDGRCRRCGHAKSSHWIRGCVAGCACGETRYLAPH